MPTWRNREPAAGRPPVQLTGALTNLCNGVEMQCPGAGLASPVAL